LTVQRYENFKSVPNFALPIQPIFSTNSAISFQQPERVDDR